MIEIRESVESHIPGILDMLGQLWPTHEHSPESLTTVLRRGLASDHQFFLTALEGESVVGFCALMIRNNLWQAANVGHMDELVVNAEHRGQGLGKLLMERIIEVAVSQGCVRLELETAFHRKDAHRFYEQNGFESRGLLFSKPIG